MPTGCGSTPPAAPPCSACEPGARPAASRRPGRFRPPRPAGRLPRAGPGSAPTPRGCPARARSGSTISPSPARRRRTRPRPGPPGPLSFAGISITGATVSWTPATDDVGVARYQVSVDGSDAGTTTADSLDLTGLDCGTAYDVAVRAADAAGNVSDPSEGTLTTSDCPDTTRPSAPGALELLGRHRDHRHRELGCRPPTTSRSTGYAVSVDGADAGTTTATSLALTGLACGSDHDVEVRAYDAAGNTSDPAAATLSTSACPDTTPPSAPGNLVADPGQDTIDLSWDASSDDVGVVGYQVSANGGLVAEPTATAASVPARCGTLYHLEVVAVDAAGNVSAPAATDVGMPACGGRAGRGAPVRRGRDAGVADERDRAGGRRPAVPAGPGHRAGRRPRPERRPGGRPHRPRAGRAGLRRRQRDRDRLARHHAVERAGGGGQRDPLRPGGGTAVRSHRPRERDDHPRRPVDGQRPDGRQVHRRHVGRARSRPNGWRCS